MIRGTTMSHSSTTNGVATTPPEPAMRDAAGKFAPGHRKIGGRRKGVLELAVEIDEAVRRADLRAAYAALAEKARAGDVPAVRVLLERLLGSVAINGRFEIEQEHGEPLSNAELAHRLVGILATAVHGDSAAAASLCGTILRGTGKPELAELAAAMEQKLGARKETNGQPR